MAKRQTQKEQLPRMDDLVREFLITRRAAGLAPKTISFYTYNAAQFLKWAQGEQIERASDFTADQFSRYLLHLSDNGHNGGGVHGAYRTIRALLLWFERNHEPQDWVNPLRRVRAPRKPKLLLDPIPLEDIRGMIAACPPNRYEGVRDKAIFRCLLDTGARANELLQMDYGDLDLVAGTIAIRHGKGGKSRTVFVGMKTRKALRIYLRQRPGIPDSAPLFASRTGERMTYAGLRDLVADRAAAAGVPRPKLHAFRRTFALEALRAGMSPFALPGILGHEDMQITRLYVKLIYDDLLAEHIKSSPGEKL